MAKRIPARRLPFPLAQADKIGTKPAQFTREHLLAVDCFWRAAKELCGTPEQAIALLTYSLSEFLLQCAKPEMIPAAVETVVECLRINTGLAIPVNRNE